MRASGNRVRSDWGNQQPIVLTVWFGGQRCDLEGQFDFARAIWDLSATHPTYRWRFLNYQEQLGWKHTVVIATAKTWVCNTSTLKNLVTLLGSETREKDHWFLSQGLLCLLGRTTPICRDLSCGQLSHFLGLRWTNIWRQTSQYFNYQRFFSLQFLYNITRKQLAEMLDLVLSTSFNRLLYINYFVERFGFFIAL